MTASPKQMTNELDAWIERIRSTDPMTFEDAYYDERPKGPGVIDRVIFELHAAVDGYTRGKFCELLGEMGDASNIPVLTAELNHPDGRVREWARLAIDAVNASTGERASAEEYRARSANASAKTR